MSDDWKAGDLALCVRGQSWFVHSGKERGNGKPVCGAIYAVVCTLSYDNMIWLGFDQFKSSCFHHARFIKVTPPAADEFDREVIALMQKQGADA